VPTYFYQPTNTAMEDEMNLISAKALNQVSLAGITLDWVKEDNSVKEVRLSDGTGGQIVIRSSQYGDALKVMVPAPPTKEDRWAVVGKFLDVADIRDVFESEHEAQNRLRDYERKASGQDTGLSLKKVSVTVDEAGTPTTAVDDIPL
jgi:hypothetical protein